MAEIFLGGFRCATCKREWPDATPRSDGFDQLYNLVSIVPECARCVREREMMETYELDMRECTRQRMLADVGRMGVFWDGVVD